MSDDEVVAALADLRQSAALELEFLEDRGRRVLEELSASIDRILSASGRYRCMTCNGTGAIERPDASYMRRFGLRDWNGCLACGGDGGENRGRGFLNDEKA